jgi:hypothetical protein
MVVKGGATSVPSAPASLMEGYHAENCEARTLRGVSTRVIVLRAPGAHCASGRRCRNRGHHQEPP